MHKYQIPADGINTKVFKRTCTNIWSFEICQKQGGWMKGQRRIDRWISKCQNKHNKMLMVKSIGGQTDVTYNFFNCMFEIFRNKILEGNKKQ